MLPLPGRGRVGEPNTVGRRWDDRHLARLAKNGLRRLLNRQRRGGVEVSNGCNMFFDLLYTNWVVPMGSYGTETQEERPRRV